jgi:hypothetical protein
MKRKRDEPEDRRGFISVAKALIMRQALLVIEHIVLLIRGLLKYQGVRLYVVLSWEEEFEFVDEERRSSGPLGGYCQSVTNALTTFSRIMYCFAYPRNL